jgi:hypothetical protein
VYDAVWTRAALPGLLKVKDYLRKPVKASLPQHDEHYTLRYELVRNNARNYKAIDKTFMQIPTFELFTYITKEFNLNILLASPLLIFSIIDYFNDGRSIRSKNDVHKYVNRFGLIDNMIEITDDNAYQLNTCFEVMKRVDRRTLKKVRKAVKASNLEDKDGFLVGLSEKEYYYQDCSYMNAQELFEVIPMYLPYLDNDLKRLRLDSIVLTDKQSGTAISYVFQSNDAEWTVVRETCINWIRSMCSIYEHQLGSNVYCQSMFLKIRQTLSEKHPLNLLTKPFFDGLYFTNNVFVDFGISIAHTDNKLVNRYMDRVELFDLSNQTMTAALQSIHEKEGSHLLDYPTSLVENGIADLHWEQKDSLLKMYKLIEELVTNVLDYYYNEEDYINDMELRNFANQVHQDFSFLGDLQVREELIKLFTNIIFLSAPRHSQSHINFFGLSSIYDYGLRKTNFNAILDKLRVGLPLADEDLYSSVSDFYKKYSSQAYPIVPINLFGYGYKNLFSDKIVQEYFDKMTNDFLEYRGGLTRNYYTEYLFRLQNSNTI